MCRVNTFSASNVSWSEKNIALLLCLSSSVQVVKCLLITLQANYPTGTNKAIVSMYLMQARTYIHPQVQ